MNMHKAAVKSHWPDAHARPYGKTWEILRPNNDSCNTESVIASGKTIERAWEKAAAKIPQKYRTTKESK